MTDKSLSVEVEGVDELLKRFSELDRALKAQQITGGSSFVGGGWRPVGADGPSTELRKAAKGIAELLARLVRISGGGASPQGAAVAASARPKSDRKPVVRMGSVALRVGSGRIPSGGGKKSRAGAVAYGANYGPGGGHLDDTVVKGLAGRFAGSNFYQQARNDGGYFVEPTIERAGPAAAARYQKAIAAIAKKWGMI